MKKTILALSIWLLSALSYAQVPGFDPYGGSLLQTCSNTNPYFALQKIGNRWWFCTPVTTASPGPPLVPANATSHVFIANAVGNIVPNIENDCNGKGNAQTYIHKYANCGLTGLPACVGGQDPGTNFNWVWHTGKLLQSWGFNAVGQDSGNISPFTTCNWGPYANSTAYCNWPPAGGSNNPNPVQMPVMTEIRPMESAMGMALVGNNVAISEPIKDLVLGENGLWTGTTNGGQNLGGGFRGSGLGNVFDSKMGTWFAYDLANSTQSTETQLRASSSPWILGMFSDDADFFYGAGAGPDFVVNSGAGNQTQIGWEVAIAAPTQTAEKQSTLGGAPGRLSITTPS